MLQNDPFAPEKLSLKDRLKRSRGLILSGLFIVIIAFIWHSYKSNDKVEQIPVIYAKQGDYKIKAENPGGLQIQNEDSTVYNALRGTEDWEDFEAEEETDDELMSQLKETEAAALQEEHTPTLVENAPEEPKIENLFDEVSEKPALPIVETKPDPEVADTSEVMPATETTETEEPDLSKNIDDILKDVTEKPATKTEPAPVAPVKKAEPAPKAVVEKTPANSGGYYIQLGSFSDQASAQDGYKQALKKYDNALNGLNVRYPEVVIEGKGTFTRVQVGQTTKEDAAKRCDMIKQKGGSCFVVSK